MVTKAYEVDASSMCDVLSDVSGVHNVSLEFDSRGNGVLRIRLRPDVDKDAVLGAAVVQLHRQFGVGLEGGRMRLTGPSGRTVVAVVEPQHPKLPAWDSWDTAPRAGLGSVPTTDAWAPYTSSWDALAPTAAEAVEAEQRDESAAAEPAAEQETWADAHDWMQVETDDSALTEPTVDGEALDEHVVLPAVTADATDATVDQLWELGSRSAEPVEEPPTQDLPPGHVDDEAEGDGDQASGSASTTDSTAGTPAKEPLVRTLPEGLVPPAREPLVRRHEPEPWAPRFELEEPSTLVNGATAPQPDGRASWAPRFQLDEPVAGGLGAESGSNGVVPGARARSSRLPVRHPRSMLESTDTVSATPASQTATTDEAPATPVSSSWREGLMRAMTPLSPEIYKRALEAALRKLDPNAVDEGRSGQSGALGTAESSATEEPGRHDHSGEGVDDEPVVEGVTVLEGVADVERVEDVPVVEDAAGVPDDDVEAVPDDTVATAPLEALPAEPPVEDLAPQLGPRASELSVDNLGWDELEWDEPGVQEPASDEPASEELPAPVSLVQESVVHEYTAPAAELPRPGHDGRLVLDRIEVATGRLELWVTVHLHAGDELHTGTASATATASGANRALVAATAKAAESALGGTLRLDVEAVDLLGVGADRVGVVVVSLLTERGVDRVTGAALVRGDARETLVRATLDALNRRIELREPEHH